MKKHLLLLFLVSVVLTAAGQTVPNSSFENWSTISYETPHSYPYTSNPEVLGQSTATPNVVKVSNSGDVYSGSYAVKISSTSDGRMGYILNSDPADGPDPSKWVGGIAYNQIPTGIQGYYKYHSGGTGTDKATI